MTFLSTVRNRRRTQIGAVVTAAAVGLVTAAAAMPPAQAQESLAGKSGLVPQVEKVAVDSLTATGISKQEALYHLAVQRESKALGSRLIHQLGARTASYFLNSAGDAVVNVLDPAAAERVRAAGADAEVVEHSSTELQAVKNRLDSIARVPQSAWGIDPSVNKVVVTISDAAPKADAARLTRVTKSFGDKVELKHTAREFKQQLLGGSGMTTGRVVCSAGFNATDGRRHYVITAGHCTKGLPSWQGVGPSLRSNFPGNDFGLIRNDSSDAPGAVDLYNGATQPISGAGNAVVGEQVCKSGRTTQYTCGRVQALNQTVDYDADGVVNGLIQTNVVTDSGDSGGALFDGSTALGVTSGGNGSTNFFQPVTEALGAYGLRLV